MANNPKKIVDPTEAALSAIQEALKVRDDDGQPENQPEPESIPEPLGGVAERWSDAPAAPTANEFLDDDESGARGRDPHAFLAANDDQQSIGQVLRALQERPPRTSYF